MSRHTSSTRSPSLRRSRAAWRVELTVVALLLVACGGESRSLQGAADAGSRGEPGTEGNACYPNGTCNAGLACLSKLCVVVPEAGPLPGAEGGSCYRNGTCDTGLECRGDRCVASANGSGGAGGSGGLSGAGGASGSGGVLATGGMPDGGGGAGGTTGSGGTIGTGGVIFISGGGMTATGGTGGAGGTTAALYTCFERQVDPDPVGLAAVGADCCGSPLDATKYFGACLAKAYAPAVATGTLGHAGCGADLLCAPKDPLTVPGLPGGKFPSCTTKLGAVALEGRCLPRCFTLGLSSAAPMGLGDCSASLGPAIGLGEQDILCAPCFNPLDGIPTGACTWFGDVPAAPAPTSLMNRECGSFPPNEASAPKMGLCVPGDLAAKLSAEVSMLPQDACDAGEICVPKSKVTDPSSCYARCDSPLGGAAACQPTYVIESTMFGTGLSATLGQVTCDPGETCVPCISPLDARVTGACND